VTKSCWAYPDLQRFFNRQAQSITGILKSTLVSLLVKEAELRSADSLLSNRHRRYAARAFKLPLDTQLEMEFEILLLINLSLEDYLTP
jgi:hypothetical protein